MTSKMAASNRESSVGVKFDEIEADMRNRANCITKKCELYLKEAPDDGVLLASLELCNKLVETCSAKFNEDLKSWLYIFCKVVLDITYHKENQLIDEEFSQPNTELEMFSLIASLDEAESCVKEWLENDTNIMQVLDTEQYECIQWRKGGLCYMYCSTLASKPSLRLEKHSHFIKFCSDGIKHLSAMMKVRKPLALTEHQVVTNDMDMYSLLKQGLFSDTHVLALMYSGELCGWFHQWASTEDKAQHSCLNARNTGISALTAYKAAVTGPLKNSGWNTQRADELLSLFGS